MKIQRTYLKINENPAHQELLTPNHLCLRKAILASSFAIWLES